MNQYKVVSVSLLTFLLSGCITIPDLGDLPALKSSQEYKTAQALPSNSMNWPSEQWWCVYGDKQLNQLMIEASDQSLTLKQAEARMEKTQAFLKQKEASLFPTLSANASYNKLRQSYTMGLPPAAVLKGFNDNTRATFDLTYEIDFWGRNRDLVAAAFSEAQATCLEAEQAWLILSCSIAAAYAELAASYAQLDAVQEALEVRKKTADLFKERHHNGLENEGSYEQASSAQSSTEAEIIALEEEIILHKSRLAALVAAGPDRAFSIQRPQILQLNPLGLPDNLPSDLIGRRPDVIAARLRSEAASKKIKAAKKSFYPSINLLAFIGYQSVGLDKFAKADSFTASAGPAINLPLFNAGSLKSHYTEKWADYKSAILEYNTALLRALYEAADAIHSQKSLSARIQASEKALDSAKKSYHLINNRYKGGLTTYLEVLRAEDTMIASRRTLAYVKTRAFTLDIALVRALGGGFKLTPASQTTL